MHYTAMSEDQLKFRQNKSTEGALSNRSHLVQQSNSHWKTVPIMEEKCRPSHLSNHQANKYHKNTTSIKMDNGLKQSSKFF